MDLNKCDSEVYNNGMVVFFTNTIRSVRMEEWVQAIAKDSGQRVDWHWCGGRAVVLALGDLHKVRKAIIRHKNMHDLFLKEAINELYLFDEDYLRRYAAGIWEYNYKTYDLWSYVCSKCQGRCMPQNHAGWQPD